MKVLKLREIEIAILCAILERGKNKLISINSIKDYFEHYDKKHKKFSRFSNRYLQGCLERLQFMGYLSVTNTKPIQYFIPQDIREDISGYIHYMFRLEKRADKK